MQSKTQLEQMLIDVSNRNNNLFKAFIQSDQKLQRQDTLRGILHLVQQFRQILHKTSDQTAQQKAKNYHVIYNTISYITQILSYIQKSSFSFESIKPLIDCIVSMENNLILADIKFLDKRTQLYIALCKIYQEAEYFQPAVLLIESAIKKYDQLRKLYELDPPVQKYVSQILDNNLFILKVLSIKFSIHANIINPSDWKKKTQQQFKQSLQKKLICLIECLRTQTKRNSNIFSKNQKNFKQTLVQQGFDLIKPSLDILSRGLKQMKEKIQFQITFKQKTMSQTLKQDEINQQIKKKRQLIGKHIKESQLKKASKNFPLQYHAQLITYAYQVKNHKVLQQLIRCAMIRVQCRRIQVPYVTDVKIQVSNTPYVNAKQGYEKINIDLNEANMKEQLKKLRKSGKTDPNAKAQISQNDQPPAGKDAKKGGKEVPPPVKQQPTNSDQPSEWQLQQINHKYVYMYLKRSYNPQKAIYNIRVVLGHEQKGPIGYEDCRRIIVPYIQKHQKIITSQIQQYKGMRESTQMVPYIILSHSQNSLQNEQQKKTLIVDVEPIIGKNPMVPPRLGFTKLNMDLRQVPQEFIKMPGQVYTFLSYKTDYQFHLSSRLIQLYHSFVQLQNSYNTLDKQGLTLQQIDKYSELSITYSLQKLDQFFSTFQDTLKGLLGQEFYLDKNDFLTNLVFQLWRKYLKQPLYQIQYIMQQRLNQQIIDYDYLLYKEIISKCKPIFLKGLKVLNLIMINNKKCDILLLSKISLELIKLLEENKEYYLASENARLALDRVRMTRDQYLTKSVQGISDRLLPFSISCDQLLIQNTINKMKSKFLQQRLLIEKINKVNILSKQGKNLNEQQLAQAQLQWKLNRVKDQYDEKVQKINPKNTQFYSLLASIDLDLSNIYFRVSLKHGDQLKKRGVNHTGYFSAGQLTGLADTLVKKLGFLQTKTNIKQHQNLKELQSTLIKAQKLPPPKPQASRPQKKLIQQSYKNPYKLSLLLLNLAALNSSNDDKKYYLKESLKALKQCKQLQENLMSNCVQNSIFIFSSIFDSQINLQKASYKTKPFQDLYNGVWPCQGQKAQQPIVVGKNSQCIYLKLPPFVYKDKKHTKKISYMKLFGKISANGVDVSTNCDQLMGTGTKQPVGKIIKVSHLQPNNNYCFAVAPLNNVTNQMMEIGKTSIDIPTHNPLPIVSIASNIAKVAYQIGELDIATQSVKIVVSQYTLQSQIIDPQGSSSFNKSINLKFNQQKLQKTSLIQIRAIAESLYVMALCQKNKLTEMKKSFKNNTVECQEKQRQILNLLTLCSTLQPALSSPITSVLLATSQLSSQFSQNLPLFQGFMITLFEKDYFSPKLRKFGVSIIRQLMSWGLQNNQISQVRRIIYKWASRKWMVLGKMIQVPVQQKKDNKKGGKDPKQVVQEQKMIDKFCHYMVQKSPLMIQQFEDELASVSQDYSDLLGVYSEGVKQAIQQLSQSMDNGPQRAEQIINNLSSKLQLSQLMKDSLNSIGKVNNSSKFYLQYNCKIIRKALQSSSRNQLKTISQKIQQFQVPQLTTQIKSSLQIFSLLQQSFQNNIQFSPQSKNLIKFIMQRTQKKQLLKTIQIYQKYQQKIISLKKSLKQTSFSLQNKNKDYDYLHMWLSEINHLKAISLIMPIQNTNAQIFKVSYKINPIYTGIQLMNLENLKKKQKQVEIIGLDKVQYDANSLTTIEKILKYITQSMYSSFCIQNWTKCINLVTILINFINYFQVTPFYHQKSKCWIYLSIISYIIVQMLKNIKQSGSNVYKQRYNKKIQNTELESIYRVLKPETPLVELFEPLYEEYKPNYFIPELSSATSKQPWFTAKQYQFLNMNRLLEIITYTTQVLNLKQQNQVIINILRQFSNVTQHAYSLQLLPFLLDSQLFLSNQVQQQIDKVQSNIKQLDQDFENQKKKHKKKRTAQITGQKMSFQIQYEQNRKKLLQKLQLLKQEKKFVNTQMQASKTIIQQIQRDCNKAALSQKQQKRYVQQFGQDEQNIWKNYQQRSQSNSIQKQGEQRSSLNKMNILSKNRKNLLKDLISKYDQIYQKLRNNKTSKDTLSQILNRNQVGNLCYALIEVQKQGDNVNRAFQFWNDALATIYRKVNPIDNYLEIIQQNSTQIVQNIGFKQILISIPILYKISQFCCYKNLNLQRKSVQFVTQIVYQLFKTSLTHPQQLLAFSNYRLKGFQYSFEKLFYDENVPVGQLRKSLQFFILKAYDTLDNSQIIRALPLVTLYEHISIDIIKKTQFAFKSKILKSLILSRCGQIKASTLNLLFIAQQKDLPILWIEKSDSLKKQKGQNWYPQSPLIIQSKPFYSPQNKQAFQLIKNITFPQLTFYDLNLQIPVLFNIAKQSLLLKLYESQIIQNFDLNQDRILNLKNIQLQMRQSLRKLSVIQQSQRLKQIYQNAKKNVQKGINVQQQQKIYQKIKIQTQNYMKNNGSYDQNQIQKYFNKKFDTLRRNQLIQYIFRTRFLVLKVNQARNVSLNCFYILKNGLANFKRYSYNARKVQTGYDQEIQISAENSNQVAGKKDDKKGGKKQPEAIKPPVKQDIDPVQQQRLLKQASTALKRTGPSSFWHLKLAFQLGYLLYRQNNFVVSLKIFEDICKNSTNFNQQYFKLYSQSYIQRCKLRLGELNKQRILSLISQIQANNFLDQEYLKLVIDFGQIYDQNMALNMFKKGLQKAKSIWQRYGMQKYICGLNQETIKRKYAISDELTAEQQDLIKKKGKKPQDNKKPGGKQQKKGAKKDDGKKKKEQSKVQYKANLLKNHTQTNLFQDQQGNSSSQFRQYSFDKHPNFYAVNVYNDYGKKYLKCFIKYWSLYLQIKTSTTDLISQSNNSSGSFQAYNSILGLIKIAQSYPENNIQNLLLLKVKSLFQKQEFLYNLSEKYIKGGLSKAQVKKIKIPFEDLPLNSRLTQIPSYFIFLTQNIKYLNESVNSFKKLISFIPQIPFILENDQQIDSILYQYSSVVMLLIQYCGPNLPKYMKLNDQSVIVQQKRNKQKTLVSIFVKLLKYTIDLSVARKKLNQQYYSFSKKQLQSSVKIDEDISFDIKNIDKQCKNVYPLFLKQSVKSKQNITSLDLLTYLLKIRRQSQVMTFSNPLENVLRKCHRILSTSLTTYKQNCLIPLPDFQKPIDNISPNSILAKSKRISTIGSNIQTQSYIYILGNSQTNQGIVYGKFNIQMNLLSTLLENCYKIQSKLKQSVGLSQAVRERNYKQLQGPFAGILKEMVLVFGGMGPVSDPQLITKQIISKNLVKLSQKSILTLINLLNGQLNEQSEQFNKFFKQLHIVKYRLKEDKKEDQQK